ncbi:exo-alpha-sialidase [Cohnella sp. CFH 77786]|uniref:WD40/YVTN/BNR-like repeat-containing protein n=1 Tax=Cohnella sp. CFH 77786 TaxID=2662265 RepID=UPI001C60A8E2|nr:sialidase family protein [Cohnella sp. CFH 77786]MBW5446019.1 exo-alpha-sialidase [Cohnella sp. CFH 77786]
MAKRMALLVGTNKGVFLYASDENRKEWSLKGPFLPGWEVYSVLGDSRHGNRIFAGTSHAAYGATIRVSEDFGETWTQIEQGPSYPKETGFSLNRIWQLVPGHPSEPDTLFAGAEEAGLFVSRDRGTTWRELDGLTKHPTRPGWFPGAGGMCLHTILIDPRNARRMWVAMSAVGVFRTEDGGETWTPRNQGLARVPTGQPQEEVGFCVHKMVLDPFNPDTLYMQEHGGVFKSTDGGDSWFTIEDGVTLRDGDAPFGFPIVVSPGGDLFLLPLESSEQRSVSGGKLLVYGMYKGENRWSPVGDAAPDEPHHVSVLRDAMAVDAFDPYGLYFGTTSGELFCSLDRGRTWERLPGQLSRILCVKPWIVED